jgi:PKD repeat protein
MIMNLHIVRTAATSAILLIVLAAEMTLFARTASGQNYGTGIASAPDSSATANPMSFGTYNSPRFGTYGLPHAPIGTSNPSQAAPNASLLAVPVVGTAPLTVDFYVGLANTSGSLEDEWVFGDGVEIFLPPQPFMLHVYQNPGTYTCELGLINAQGITTTVFATITVNPAVSPNGS